MKRLVSRFTALLNALDSIFRETNDNDIKALRDDLLEPNTTLMLLLIADLLAHINPFSTFLQKKNLLYSNIATKYERLKEEVKKLMKDDGPLFSKFAPEFFQASLERMAFARRMQNTNLMDHDDEIHNKINLFKQEIKQPFLEAVLRELALAMNVDDPVFIAFDVFNPSAKLNQEEIATKITTLTEFYGKTQGLKFEGVTNKADPLINDKEITPQIIDWFFSDFQNCIKKKKKNEIH